MKIPVVIKNSLLALLSLVLLSLVMLSAGVQAEPVANLYSTVVPVANQSHSERMRAMRIGLGKVLVKVTGDSQSLAEVSFSNPERYVTQFGYVSYQDPMSPGSEADGLAMKLNYASSAVNRLLRRYQLQVWPSDRPGLLVWMVVDDPALGRRFVAADDMPELVISLTTLMEDRGAPLILPMLDLQDSQTISERDVWNLDLSKLDAASARYNTSAWLAFRFYQSSNGQWRAAQLFSLNGENSLDNVVADNLPALMNKVIPAVVDKLASHYAYIPKKDAETVFLQLDNVGDYPSFNDVIDYLESLEVVRRVAVIQVENDRLDLQLFVEGDVSLLLDTLRRDRRMVEQPVVNPIQVSPVNAQAQEVTAADTETIAGVETSADMETSTDAENRSYSENRAYSENSSGQENTLAVEDAGLKNENMEINNMEMTPAPQHFSFRWGRY